MESHLIYVNNVLMKCILLSVYSFDISIFHFIMIIGMFVAFGAIDCVQSHRRFVCIQNCIHLNTHQRKVGLCLLTCTCSVMCRIDQIVVVLIFHINIVMNIELLNVSWYFLLQYVNIIILHV